VSRFFVIVLFALFIDLLTDKVQPLSRMSTLNVPVTPLLWPTTSG
jgi:hypothetical protein